MAIFIMAIESLQSVLSIVHDNRQFP